jgi:uncharacterized protein (DUF2141 family)
MHIRRNILIMGIVSVLFSTPLLAQPKGVLKVSLKPFKKIEGTVYVCLYASKDPFLGKPRLFIKKRVSSAKIDVKFPSVPYGYYAVTVYQDLNKNGILDVSLTGPVEPWGLSNNFSPVLAVPKFDDCKFLLNSSVKSIEIEVK